MDDDVLVVRMDGFTRPAGYLARVGTGETGFIYDNDYAASGGLPLSISLPFAQEEFGDIETRAFFANLLPENTQLQRVMEREGLARDDIVGLLHHLGADCAGSVSCLPVDAAPAKTPGLLAEDYEPLEPKALEAIVKSLYESRRLPAQVRDPSPVAGVQGKIAVTLLPDRRFALPRPGLRVPTTHILKVPERAHRRDPHFEVAAALLAAAAGLDVSIPQVVRIGEIDALLIERFDRRVAGGRVTRIHQEDFAQALGLPAELKYERNGRDGRRFDIGGVVAVLERTVDPGAAKLAFIRTTLFNLCIGNTDNHAKNHGLLYDRGPAPRFAPLYDLLPIRLSSAFTHELAFRIGAATHFDDMTTADLTRFLRDLGVEPRDVPRFVDSVVTGLLERIERATPALRSGAGMKSFDDLIGREMEHMVELFGLGVAIQERDYFPSDGS